MKDTPAANPAQKGANISPVIQETLEKLMPLLGVWTGRGSGDYPTIDGFEYAETLRIRRDGGAAYLTYEQSTDLVDSEGRSIEKSHWESGVLRPLDDGSIELACVQGSGRVEILRGVLQEMKSQPEDSSLRFHSELIGNDERLRSTSREWTLSGDHLKYVMNMATTSIEEVTLHVEANLVR